MYCADPGCLVYLSLNRAADRALLSHLSHWEDGPFLSAYGCLATNQSLPIRLFPFSLSFALCSRTFFKTPLSDHKLITCSWENAWIFQQQQQINNNRKYVLKDYYMPNTGLSALQVLPHSQSQSPLRGRCCDYCHFTQVEREAERVITSHLRSCHQ